MAQGSAVAEERRARASARYVRMAPMKVRRVVDLIRGMEAREIGRASCRERVSDTV